MPNKNLDYLRWDALGTKEAIRQKLSQNPVFTDHIFEDSNLTTLIDVFAHTFDILSYYVNHGASEAMFTDAVIYENVNRMSKMLNYNPSGHASARTECIVATKPNMTLGQLTGVLPKYTAVDTGKSDDNGDNVFYSLVNSRFLSPDSNGVLSSDDAKSTNIMVNGKWQLYENTFISDGSAFQSFTLSNLDVAGDNGDVDYISHPYVDVFIKNSNDGITAFTPIPNGTLFNTNSTLVSPEDEVYEIRLNESLQYTITFGDGVHGTRLNAGDEIYVVYLRGNGKGGEIPVNFLGETNAITTGIVGMDTDLYDIIVESTGVDEDNKVNDLDTIYFKNITNSTKYNAVENVESIKSNAPAFFRQGDRLINGPDYETFIKATFRNDVYDVVAMNNYEYLVEFLNWLKTYGKLTNDAREATYPFADPCDFNNIYLWTKYKGHRISPAIIESDLYRSKSLTAEPIVIEAVPMFMVPSLNIEDYSINNWDPCIENWIEIEKDPNSMISADRIKQRAVDTFTKFFDESLLNIGQTLNLSQLQTALEGIEGVKAVRTVYLSNDDQIADNCSAKQTYNGLKFATWTREYITGADLALHSGSITMNRFQYAKIVHNDTLQIQKRIKIKYTTVGGQFVEY